MARDRFYEVINKSMPVTSITNSVIMDYMASLNQIFDQVTSVGYCQKIKTIVQFALDNDRMRINPFCTMHLRKGEKTVQYLTEEELARIKNFDAHNASLNRVRDLFVFQAASGLSYTDMEKLEPSDYQKEEGSQHEPRYMVNVYYNWTNLYNV